MSDPDHNTTTPHIIAIVGGSCSGKTTLSWALQRKLGSDNCLVICQDDYYVDIRDRVDDNSIPNFDIPEAIDWDALSTDIKALKAGRSVALPNYDFTTHRRERASTAAIPKPFVIIEGMLLLTMPSMRALFDQSYYIQCPSELRYARRMARDTKERGRTAEFVKRQFTHDVEPAHHDWIVPSSAHADHIIAQAEYTGNLVALLDRMTRECHDCLDVSQYGMFDGI